jgi:hypothetical protein
MSANVSGLLQGVDMRFDAGTSIPGDEERNTLQGRKGGY